MVEIFSLADRDNHKVLEFRKKIFVRIASEHRENDRGCQKRI